MKNFNKVLHTLNLAASDARDETIKRSESHNSENVGTDGGQTNPEDPSVCLKTLNMGSISIQQHDMEIW